MAETTRPTAVVLGAGPGLGMSVAHRFGRAGYDVALVSRTDTRHSRYLASLADAGITAEAFVGDVRTGVLATLDAITERFGTIDFVYYGPASTDPDNLPGPITEADSAAVERAMSWVYPAVDVVGRVLPGMRERGRGGLLFAGGLSSVRPMPALGALAVSAAALRNYAVTLHAGLDGTGVYAGSLTIGGVIERGDVHRLVASQPAEFGDLAGRTLDPDVIADAAWRMYSESREPEGVFSVFD
ncbi:SDR family NAD(P)-dependent oxidoreductase [Amycolatopsis saalfeldensis]|uniref:Short-chain dehydrogenase n=1 Tax=Amycolatopsis saalfeldensis TaxID=394193 RepID=A0A1H8YHX9_9PSEU|nr:SDR family NAD(P)-dependent oxidoreductase [Amycolatopsis saalfeldensis]SEP51824.1 Short-chain dehydrogenase [Amycolatopsis saalfeldensis]